MDGQGLGQGVYGIGLGHYMHVESVFLRGLARDGPDGGYGSFPWALKLLNCSESAGARSFIRLVTVELAVKVTASRPWVRAWLKRSPAPAGGTDS